MKASSKSGSTTADDTYSNLNFRYPPNGDRTTHSFTEQKYLQYDHFFQLADGQLIFLRTLSILHSMQISNFQKESLDFFRSQSIYNT